jgi:hypothetical protein
MLHARFRLLTLFLSAACVAFAGSAALARARRGPQAGIVPAHWVAVAHALGVPGEIRGDVFRVDFAPALPRIRMGRVFLAPGALDPSWVSFGDQAVLGWMIGRVTLTSAQAPAAIGRMTQAGIEVTGAFDPLPGASPSITTVYFREMGEAGALARSLRQALGPALRPPASPRRFSVGRLDVAAIDRILNRRGQPVSGALVFRVVRPERIKCCGVPSDPLLVFSGLPLGPATGVESRFAFQPLPAGALVVGRLAVRHDEISPVERAFSVFGIRTVSLAEPLVDEQPRISFLYFFGRGKTLELAGGLRAAIERIHHLPPVTPP